MIEWDVQAACNSDLIERAGKLRLRRGVAVDAQVARIEQTHDFRDRGALQMQAHGELLGPRAARTQNSARADLAVEARAHGVARGVLGSALRRRAVEEIRDAEPVAVEQATQRVVPSCRVVRMCRPRKRSE